MYIVYLAIHSLVLSIFGLFRDFAPIPMYGENEKTVSSLHREYGDKAELRYYSKPEKCTAQKGKLLNELYFRKVIETHVIKVGQRRRHVSQ